MRRVLGISDDLLKRKLGGWGEDPEGFGARGLVALALGGAFDKRIKVTIAGAVGAPVYSDDLGDYTGGGRGREVA